MTLRVINFADGFTSDNVPVADAIQAHIDNPTDAHDASAISFDNVDSELVAINVQDAIDEVEVRLDTAETDISDHVDNETDAHNASAISYVNTTSGLVAIEVQAAIDEVESRLGTAETDIQTIEDSVGQANGIAPLNGSSKIDATYLPSYVDDVLEYADLISFPLVGETSKIYVTLDTNKTYRWTGSVYIEISASEVTSVNSQSGAVVLDADDIAETASRYWSKKNNVTTTAPTVSNDLSQNYSVGSQWYDSAADTLYICESASIGAALWQPISGAGGGVGSVDIMFADTFENTDIADYTITQPLASISAISPLQGENSLLIAHDHNPSYYIERIIPIDSKFKNKNVTFSLDVFTDAASGNLTLSAWDHTNTVQLLNSELIQPQEVNQTSVKRSFSFNIPSDANELRYRINVLFDSGKVSRVDNLVIELTQMSKLDTTIEIPVITKIQAIAPTIGLTGGTLSTQDGEIRQIGEKLEMTANFKWSSIFTGGTATITLPNNLVIDTSKIAGGVPTNVDIVLGKAVLYDSSASASYFGSVVYNSSTSVIIKYDFNTNGNAYPSTFNSTNISTTLPFAWAANDEITVDFSAPILGWEATETQSVSLAQTVLVQESDSALDVYGGAFGSTNTRVVRFASTSVNIGDAITYVPSLTLGDSFIINRAGVYDLSFSAKISVSGQLAITKNLIATGNVVTGDELLTNTEISATNYDGNCSTSAYLEVGDVVRCSVGSGSFQSATDKRACNFQISYQGKLKQLNVSENQKIEIPTSELRMEGASARGIGAETFTAKYTNIAKVRGDAFSLDNSNATIVTMKKKGRLNVSASIRTNTSAASITKNQAVNTAAPLASERMSAALVSTATAGIMSMHACFDVNIGDVIRVNAEATPTADSGNSLTLSFQEQEVAVSVTNVLPQFSESDSSVRVDTANGYGSTATKIRRFSNVRENLGSSIVYADSATNGSSFTINEDGVYNVSYSDSATAADYSGISKNASSLTTNLNSLVTSEILALERQDTSGGAFNIAWSGYLQAGDIIRAHSSGTGGGNNALVTFTISKVGKPNVTGVDVTPFAKIEYEVKQFIEQIAATSVWVSNIARFQNLNLNTNNGLIQYSDDGTNGTRFTALKSCELSVSVNGKTTTTSAVFIRRNGVTIATGYGNNAAESDLSTSAVVRLNTGDYIDITRDTTASPSVRYLNIVATELRDAYQVIGGGVENTYSARIALGATLISESYPFIDSVVSGGTGIYNITFKAGFFPVAPSGLITPDNTVGNGYGRVTATTSSASIVMVNTSGSPTNMAFTLQVTRQGSDYRTPSKAIGLPAQRIAYIKDVKASGTSGGAFTSGSWLTRTLNNIDDPTGLVVSLASSQFILPAGIYDIEVNAPAYNVARHKAKLRNITDSVDLLIGGSDYNAQAAPVQTSSVITGRINITSQKTFEIQHRATVTKTVDGFGVETLVGVDEVYTQVKIVKVEE